ERLDKFWGNGGEIHGCAGYKRAAIGRTRRRWHHTKVGLVYIGIYAVHSPEGNAFSGGIGSRSGFTKPAVTFAGYTTSGCASQILYATIGLVYQRIIYIAGGGAVKLNSRDN